MHKAREITKQILWRSNKHFFILNKKNTFESWIWSRSPLLGNVLSHMRFSNVNSDLVGPYTDIRHRVGTEKNKGSQHGSIINTKGTTTM